MPSTPPRDGASDPSHALSQAQHAGLDALARSEVADAIAHFDRALALLDAMAPGAARARIELDIVVPRAGALRAARGVAAPATGAAYDRAVALARQVGDGQRLIQSLNGLYAYHMVRGECTAAISPAHELLRVASEHGDTMQQMIGHRAVGAVAFHIGQPLLARQHLERALMLYDATRHAPLAVALGIDHRVASSNFLALTLFVLDEPDAAQALQRDTLAYARELGHAHSLAQALVFGCLLLALREDWHELRAWAVQTCDIGREHGYPLMEGGGRFFLGAATAFEGALAEGLAQMQAGAAQWWATGARNYEAAALMWMGRAHAALGEPDAALACLHDAQARIADSGERWIEPALWRVQWEWQREVFAANAQPLPLVAPLVRSLELARAQQARRWERLARESLAAAGSPAAGA